MTGTVVAVRPVTHDDLPELARMHFEAFGHEDDHSPADVERAYVEVFPRLYPLDDATTIGEGPTSPSLVLDGKDRLEGFVSVARREFTFDGKQVWAAVTSQLTVSEDARGSLGAVRLLREVFDGPQDFTLADRSNRAGRKALTAAGADVFAGYSLRWDKVLDPDSLLVDRATEKLPAGPAPIRSLLASTAGPVLSAVNRRTGNRLARRLFAHDGKALPERPPTFTSAELAADELVSVGPSILASRGIELHPTFGDADRVQRTWKQIDEFRPNGSTAKLGVFSKRGRLVGWYLFHVANSGRAEVIQLAALPDAQPGVLACLLHDAADRGAVMVQGDLTPDIMFDMCDLGCTVRAGNAATSVHTSNEAILDSFRRGTAFVSGLEGEYLLDPPTSLRVPVGAGS